MISFLICSIWLFIHSIGHGESNHIISNGLRNEHHRRHTAGTSESESNKNDTSTATSSSAATSSMASVVSTLPPPQHHHQQHPNAQFLLANPWLHTSLLYSQLYNQRIQQQQAPITASSLSAGVVDSPSVDANFAGRSSPSSDTTPKSDDVASSPVSSKDRDKELTEIGGKRTEVWRPYWIRYLSFSCLLKQYLIWCITWAALSPDWYVIYPNLVR